MATRRRTPTIASRSARLLGLLALLGGCSREQPAGAPAGVRTGQGGTPAAAARRSGVSPPASSRARAPSTPPPASAQADPARARVARQRLVRQIATLSHPWSGEPRWDPRVLDALGRVARHRFMPGASITAAYQDTAYPIGHGQTISQPTVVAVMTQALRLTGRERVLEIGTGSGYQAAVLSLLAAEVYSIEIVRPLGEQARARLARLGYRNVTVRIGDGYRGWPDRAPFDRIVLTAAPPEMPEALVTQLAAGGILVAPVGDREQELVRWTRRGKTLHKETLGAVVFVPMVPARR